MNKKQKTQQRRVTALITLTMYSVRYLHLPAAAGQPGFAVYCGRAAGSMLKLIK